MILPLSLLRVFQSLKGLSKEMLRGYYQYYIAISAEPESFPSEQLVLALISSQYKKIIHWLIEKGFKI